MFFLVGGFNPSEKYQSKWKSSPNRGEHEKYLKPPPSSSIEWDFSEATQNSAFAKGHFGKNLPGCRVTNRAKTMGSQKKTGLRAGRKKIRDFLTSLMQNNWDWPRLYCISYWKKRDFFAVSLCFSSFHIWRLGFVACIHSSILSFTITPPKPEKQAARFRLLLEIS